MCSSDLMDSPDIWQPQTRETADHSLPCTVAMALLDGTITPAMMENERYKSADVLTLMARCRIELPDEFAALAPQTRCCRITATLNDGRVVTSEVRRSLADDAADTGWAQAVNKFMQLTEKLLPRETRAKIVEQTAALETLGPLREWVALTTLPH